MGRINFSVTGKPSYLARTTHVKRSVFTLNECTCSMYFKIFNHRLRLSFPYCEQPKERCGDEEGGELLFSGAFRGGGGGGGGGLSGLGHPPPSQYN